MGRYQVVSLLVLTAAVAFVVGLRVGEGRAAGPVRGGPSAGGGAAGDGGACCLPAAAAPSGRAERPAIPTGSGLPCLVEFGSDECPACRRMQAALAEVRAGLRGRVEVVSVDTDVHLAEAQRWRLRVVPTQLLVDARGQERWRHEGELAASELLAKVKAVVR